jgi:hypothetical protein
VNVCSDSHAALLALQTAKTTPPLVWQCQKLLNDISIRHNVGLYWVPGWTCWGTRKRNRRQSRKRWFCSKVCWTWAVFGSL